MHITFPFSRVGLLLAAALAANIACAWDEPAEVHFPPPPRLATTAAELAAWKSSGEWERRRAAALATAETLLSEPVAIPSKWGDWIFYYACPDDGTSLTPQSQTEHRCPRCEKVYDDERTVAAYRTSLYYKADQAALDLGWAFALSGDERFAREARRILLAYAENYPQYPSRRDRWGREGVLATIGGRRFCQSLDEAVGIISLAKAYDLTRSSAVWTDEDRRKAEQGLFQTVADVLLVWNYGTINHQTWYNAGLMAIANVNADAKLARKVVTMRGGYRDQLARAIGSDGMWREGTMAYHGYALQAMEELVDAACPIGLPLHTEPRLRLMLEFPALYAYPNGQFPAVNDSDPLNLAAFDGHFRWAWKTLRDPSFAQSYARGSAEKAAELLGPGAETAALPRLPSRDLAGAGLVALRRGQDEAASCAMLDYGEHGGGHGHPDKLQLLLYAQGREWLLDPGRLDYSHREHKTWYRQTAAHNTVVIGGHSQLPCTGKLLWLKSHETFEACATDCSEAYAKTRLRRYLLLEDDRLLDVYDVEAPSDKSIDWLMHCAADSVTLDNAESAPADGPLGSSDGYEHFSNIVRWSPSRTDPRCDITAGPHKLRVWLAASSPETIFSAQCPGYNLEPKIPCMIRRTKGGHVTFAAVYDWSAEDRRTFGVGISQDGELQIRRATGTTLVRFSEDGVTVQEKQ
ncbi:MAG: heparinase II/III family protein [Pirellulales bacterium]